MNYPGWPGTHSGAQISLESIYDPGVSAGE